MLRAALISPDRSLTDQVQSALAALPIRIVRVVDYYPGEAEVPRLLRSVAPQIVLLSADSVTEAVTAARTIEAAAPGLPIVALGRQPSSTILLEMMRAGVREFLQTPFDQAAVVEAMARVRETAERIPRPIDSTENLFAFLPSKAGVGATTVAVNMSAALAALPDTRVLLADFDLNSGLVGFMLKQDKRHSVTSAAENCLRMDDGLWRQLVSTIGSLDVLPAGKINPGFRIEPVQIRTLVDFVRRIYRAICIDLSGNLEKYSVELLRESKRILLVCTAELPSLHLAREKLTFLHSIDLEDRVDLVLNRASKRDVVRVEEIERLLGRKIRFTFPNDYRGIHQSLASGQPAARASELGKRFHQAAEELMSGKVREAEAPRRFVEYFSIVPGRYRLMPSGKKTA